MSVPPGRRSERSNNGVLDAAATVADRRGYRGATIEEIAVEAGVAKQTVYRWWPSKAVLYIDVYECLVPRDDIATDTGSLRGDLENLVARLSRLYADTPAGTILAGLIAEAQTDDDLSDRLRDVFVAPRRAILGTILHRAVDRGEIPPPVDPDFTSDLFSGAVWFQLLLGERRLNPDFARRLVEAVTRSVAGP